MTEPSRREVVLLSPGAGRSYSMGRLTAIFLADGAETEERYSVSEWRLDAGQPGVGAHMHAENDEIFLVLEGTPDFFLGDHWISCAPGSFLCIPAGTMHDFRNFGSAPARVFNVFLGDGFERNMPAIVDWFANSERADPAR